MMRFWGLRSALSGGRRWPPIAGDVVFHGTASDETFDDDDLDGPAWVSDSPDVARWFADRFGGGRPRVLRYRVMADPELFVWEHTGHIDQTVGPDWEHMDVHELAEAVCDRGWDGWFIPHNYPEGADIMLCEPGRWLDFEGTEGG